MAIIVKTRIIKIGNSRGVRIPKLLLDQADLGEEVELRLEEKQIVIQPVQGRRANWAEEFKAMAQSGDDLLLDGQELISQSYDEEEWVW